MQAASQKAACLRSPELLRREARGEAGWGPRSRPGTSGTARPWAAPRQVSPTGSSPVSRPRPGVRWISLSGTEVPPLPFTPPALCSWGGGGCSWTPFSGETPRGTALAGAPLAGGGVPLGAVPGALRSAGFCLARFCFKRFGFPVSGAPACGAPSGCVVNLGSGSCLRTTWLRPSRARLAGAERAR